MAEISDWDSTANSNNQASPNGFPEGMPPSGVNDSARENMAQIKRFWARVNGTQTTTGNTTALSVSYSITPSALVDGEIYSFKVHTAVGNAPTLVIKGHAALKLYKPTQNGVVTVSASDILAGQRIITQYDSSISNQGAGLVIVGGGPFGGPPIAASYLVTSASAASGISNARVLKAGPGLTTSLSTGAQYVQVDYGKSATYAAQQVFGCVSLSDSTTISWDLTTAQVAAVTLGGNRVVTVSNPKNGGCYVLRVISGGTSSISFAAASNVKWPGGTAGTYTQSAGAMDIVTLHSDGTNLYAVVTKEFR